MKKLLLSLALMVATLTTFAQTDPYTVTLAQAVWNFDGVTSTHPSCSNENFLIPDNCLAATGGTTTRAVSSAYLPYIYPNQLNTTDTKNYGYNNGHYALYIGTPRNDGGSRLPALFILPSISDAAYTNLELHLFARQENATTQTLKIGYIANLDDVHTDTYKFSGSISPIQSLSLTATYSEQTVALSSIPANGHVVLYVETPDAAAEYFYLDNISIRTKSGSTPDPEPEPEPTTYTVTYNLTGCTGGAENPTTASEEDLYLYPTFTANDGYTLDGAEINVTMGEVVFSDYYMDDYNYYLDGTTLYLTLGDGAEDDIVVTVTAKQAAVKPDVPTTFTAATFEEFTIAENSVYRPSTMQVGDNWLISGGVVFSSRKENWGGGSFGYSGIQVVNYANGTATGSDAYLPAATAAKQGDNYATVNIMGLFTQVEFATTTLSGLLINNTAFNVNSFQNGDGYAHALAQGDWFKVTFTGLKDGIVTNSLDFYLADYRTAGAWTYVADWTWVDLSTLGEINALQFSLDGTDKGAWGLNTSSYFCFDNLGGNPIVTALGETIDGEPTFGNPSHGETMHGEPRKLLRAGQVFILRGEHLYSPAGQIVR